jgi:hypothetical protein
MSDDYPTNNDRTAWAAAAAEVFGGFSGQNDPEYLIEPVAVAEVVGDLICDLLHFVEAAGGDPTTVLFNGLGHYEHEAAEEAAEQLEADSRYLAFAHYDGLGWDLLVCDSLRSARREFADRAAGANAEAVMLLYRSLDPETEPMTAGDSFAPAAYVLTATAEGNRVDRQ